MGLEPNTDPKLREEANKDFYAVVFLLSLLAMAFIKLGAFWGFFCLAGFSMFSVLNLEYGWLKRK